MIELLCLLLDTAVCYTAGTQTKTRGQISRILSNYLVISWKQPLDRLLQQFLLLFSIFLHWHFKVTDVNPQTEFAATSDFNVL